MMDEPAVNPESSKISQSVFESVSTVIASLMITCLSITLTLFAQKAIIGWQAGYLPVLCFLVSLERMFTHRQLKRMQLLSKSWFVFQLTHWVVVLAVLKIVSLVAQRPESLWMEIQLWRLDFITYFFDTGYTISVLFIVIIWWFSGYFASLLDEMSLEEALVRLDTAVIAPVEGPPAREKLLGIFFGLGFVLVILTAMMRVNMRMVFLGEFDKLGIQPLPYLAAGAWNVLLYFLLGLVLMSLSHLARLNARWRFQKLEISAQLASRWVIYSLVFIGLISLVASLLPTNYSLGFLSILSYVLHWILTIIFFLFSVLWSVVIFLVSLFAQLIGLSFKSDRPPLAETFTPPEPPPEISASGGEPWIEFLKSLAFWLVFAAVIGFSFYQFIRQHESIVARILQFPGFSWLARFWGWVRGGFRGFNQQMRAVVGAGIDRLRTRRLQRLADRRGGFVNMRRLSPRQRVYFFFLAMVRRGGEQGLDRKGSQTPYEYATALEEALPDVDLEVANLTEAFVEARYSRETVDDRQAGLVKRYWERIRGALRSFHR